ncbi:MAG: hypothetical protein ACL9RN_02515 [Cylindrospermopsis raciborskii]|uniref:hypothetical protein n=1 Tax=Cylindrospermopsis raciborskii TaxID=77022 RepID=UPI003D0CF325
MTKVNLERHGLAKLSVVRVLKKVETLRKLSFLSISQKEGISLSDETSSDRTPYALHQK